MLGTSWTTPGEGDYALDLRNAVVLFNTPEANEAYKHLSRFIFNQQSWLTKPRTNIKLTGNPLQEIDFRRLAVCE